MVNWIYTHEVLVAGLLSILAAMVTIFALIWLAQKEECRLKMVRQNRLLAVKVELCLIKSDFTRYSFQTCPSFIRVVEEAKEELDIGECPISDRHMRFIKELIENSDDSDEQNQLAHLVKTLRHHQAELGYLVNVYSPEIAENNEDLQDILNGFKEENDNLKIASDKLRRLLYEG